MAKMLRRLEIVEKAETLEEGTINEEGSEHDFRLNFR